MRIEKAKTKIKKNNKRIEKVTKDRILGNIGVRDQAVPLRFHRAREA